LVLPGLNGGIQLFLQLIAYGTEPGDAGVDLGQLAPEHGDRVGTHVAGRVAGPQARDERADVVQVEAHGEQCPDLADDPQLGVGVRAVSGGGAVRLQQAVRLVIPQRPGTDAGASGQFTDQHGSTLNLVAGVNANGRDLANS
jgi:hypothetical protein